MKADIHPQQFETRIVCSSCGSTFSALSSKQEIHVEVCHKCHPFYTGEHRFLDSKGRVEDFQRKQKAATELQIKYQDKKNKKDKKGQYEPKSLKELLTGM